MNQFLNRRGTKLVCSYILPLVLGVLVPALIDIWASRGSTSFFYILLILTIILGIWYAYTTYMYLQNEKQSKKEVDELNRKIKTLEEENIKLSKNEAAFDKGMRELATLFYDSSESLNKIAKNILNGDKKLELWNFKKVATGICNSVYVLICELCKPYDDFTVNIMLADPIATGRKKNITMIAHKGKYQKFPGKFEEKLYFEKYGSFYAVKVCKSGKTDIRVLTTKEEVNENFVYIDESHPDYSQYIGIPIVCSGNRIICLLQICAFGDQKIAETKREIVLIVKKYLYPFMHYALLSYKTEKSLISSLSTSGNYKVQQEGEDNNGQK